MSPSATATVTQSPIPNAPHDSRQLPITQIQLSRLNPRNFNAHNLQEQHALTELADSIRQSGIIQPIVVRPVDGDIPFEIVAGERRFRAATEVGLTTVPVIVRHATDAEVLLLALTENRQRKSVHALDEAESIQQLMALDPAYTVAGLAFKLGVSTTWVYNHLKLLTLIPAAKDAYRADAITAGHAEALSRVPADRQPAALEACFSLMLFDDAAAADPNDRELPHTIADAIAQSSWLLLGKALVSESELKRWIARHSTVDLADKATQEALPEVADLLEDEAVEHARVPRLSALQYPTLTAAEAKALGVVRWGRWIEIIVDATEVSASVSSERCEAMTNALVTHPADQPPRAVMACLKRGCPVHRPAVVADTAGRAERRRGAAQRGRAATAGPRQAAGRGPGLEGRPQPRVYG